MGQKQTPIVLYCIAQWLCCIVGNVGGRFLKGRRTCGEKKGNISVVFYCVLLYCCIDFESSGVVGVLCYTSGLLFKTLAPTLPTMQLCHRLTSLEAVYQITCSFLCSHKRLFYCVFSHAVVLLKTC